MPTCLATRESRPCDKAATMTTPVLLCDEHRLQVASIVTSEVMASAIAKIRTRRLISDADSHLIASASSTGIPASEHHGATTYFLVNGGRVKIGHTKTLSTRLRALSLNEDSLLLLLHGGPALERALHLKFDTYRVGDSEWFELSPEIVHFIASKQPQVPAEYVTRKNRRRKPAADRPKRTRRPMADWVELAGPVFHEEFERLHRQPTGDEFAEAIKKAKLGTVSASTAKNIRTEILDRAPLPTLD